MFDRNKAYWVLTNENEIQNMTKYHDGEVEYTNVMGPGDCCTGIVFGADDIFSCVSEYTKYIRRVYIPENATVMEMSCKDQYGKTVTLYKTNNAIMDPRIAFDETIVRELIEVHHVDMNVSYSRILKYFCDKEDISAVKYLLSQGINVNYPDLKYHPILDCIKRGNTALFKIMYKTMKKSKDNPTYMKNLITNIVAYGNVSMMRYVIFRGVMPILKTKTFSTDEEFQKRLVKQACVSGKLDMLKYLVERLKIHPNIFYNGVLEGAIISSEEHPEIVKYLISKKVNIHHDDDKAFRTAVQMNRLETVRMLVEAGANYHVYGNIALLIAYKNEFEDLLDYLIGLDDINRLASEAMDQSDDVLYTV